MSTDPVQSATPPSALGELAALWQARTLLAAFTRNEIGARYVGSSLGLFWTIIIPLLELLTYTFVFHTLLSVSFHPAGTTQHYVLFLFCGMLAWAGFADGITRCTTCITDHAHLVRKLNFPAIVLPAHLVLSTLVNQGFRFVILLLGMLLIGDGWSWHVVLALPFFLVQAALTLGVGMFLATLNVYFRDMGHWVNAALMFGMFVTPVFYPASAYPRQFILLLAPNPMAQFIGIYQSFLLNQDFPPITSMLYAVIVSGVALMVGASVFAHNRKEFPDLV